MCVVCVCVPVLLELILLTLRQPPLCGGPGLGAKYTTQQSLEENLLGGEPPSAIYSDLLHSCQGHDCQYRGAEIGHSCPLGHSSDGQSLLWGTSISLAKTFSRATVLQSYSYSILLPAFLLSQVADLHCGLKALPTYFYTPSPWSFSVTPINRLHIKFHLGIYFAEDCNRCTL